MDPGCQLWEVEEGDCDECVIGSTDQVNAHLACFCYIDSLHCNQQK